MNTQFNFPNSHEMERLTHMLLPKNTLEIPSVQCFNLHINAHFDSP